MWVKHCHEPILATYSSFMDLLGIIGAILSLLMWVKQCHQPPIIISIPPIKMVMTGGWFNGIVLPTFLGIVFQ